MTDIYEDFLTIRPTITLTDSWQFIGSFKRNKDIYSKNINLMTDIDIVNFTPTKNWNDMKQLLFSQKNDKLVFLYSTCGINRNFVIDWEIKSTDLKDFDFKHVMSKIIKLKANKSISPETADKWLSYIKDKTLEGLVTLENEMNSRLLVRWDIDELKLGYKVLGNELFHIKTEYEKYSNLDNKDYRATFHWLWFYKETFVPVDCSIILMHNDKKQIYIPKHMDYARWYNMNVFYKQLYIIYAAHNWFKLFRELKRPAKDFGYSQVYNEIEYVTETEFALHKAILSKLSRLSFYIIRDDHKEKKVKIHVFADKQKEFVKIFDNLKPLMRSIGFKVSDDEQDNVKVEHDFKKWLDNKSIPFYNKYRLQLIALNPKIEAVIPGAI